MKRSHISLSLSLERIRQIWLKAAGGQVAAGWDHLQRGPKPELPFRSAEVQNSDTRLHPERESAVWLPLDPPDCGDNETAFSISAVIFVKVKLPSTQNTNIWGKVCAPKRHPFSVPIPVFPTYHIIYIESRFAIPVLCNRTAHLKKNWRGAILTAIKRVAIPISFGSSPQKNLTSFREVDIFHVGGKTREVE